VVHARALAAYDQVVRAGFEHTEALVLGKGLADAVLRVAGAST
jgi:hypothetical protein